MLAWEKAPAREGVDLYRLSQTPLGVKSLEWSPNGRLLVLHTITGNPSLIRESLTFPVIVDRDTLTAWSTLVEDTAYCLEHSDWSPDGQTLAYLDSRQLWMADGISGNRIQQALPPTADGLYTLRYSPDGGQIALLSGRVQADRMVYDLWLRPSTSAKDVLLQEDAGYGMPVWSQDGGKIALLNEIGILWIFDLLRGTTAQADLNPVPGSEVCLADPAWVAGSSMVLAAIRHTTNVWLVDLGGGARLLLPEEAGSANRPPGLAAPLRGGPSAGASASPDGGYAVFWSSVLDTYLIDFSADKVTHLPAGVGGSGIAWSPDGAQFVSAYWNSAFLLVNAMDGAILELDPNSLFPAWSPDGRYIAYWKIEHQAQLDGFSLHIYDTLVGTSWRYLDPDSENPSGAGGGWSYNLTPHWSPDGRSIAFVSNRSGDPQAYLLQVGLSK